MNVWTLMTVVPTVPEYAMMAPYQLGQFHRLSDAFALSASPFECSTTPLILAQNESFRDPP
jgi:hypothetical protein